MKIKLEAAHIGDGSHLFHVTVDRSGDVHGTMCLVAANNMATALYKAWSHYHDDVALDLDKCDGYMIGKLLE